MSLSGELRRTSFNPFIELKVNGPFKSLGCFIVGNFDYEAFYHNNLTKDKVFKSMKNKLHIGIYKEIKYLSNGFAWKKGSQEKERKLNMVTGSKEIYILFICIITHSKESLYLSKKILMDYTTFPKS